MMTSTYITDDNKRERMMSYCDSLNEILSEIVQTLNYYDDDDGTTPIGTLQMRTVRLARDAQADWQLLAPMLTDVIERANG